MFSPPSASLCLLAKYLNNRWIDFNETHKMSSLIACLHLIGFWMKTKIKWLPELISFKNLKTTYKSVNFKNTEVQCGMLVAESYPNTDLEKYLIL